MDFKGIQTQENQKIVKIKNPVVGIILTLDQDVVIYFT